jgi:hypothetical protein
VFCYDFTAVTTNPGKSLHFVSFGRASACLIVQTLPGFPYSFVGLEQRLMSGTGHKTPNKSPRARSLKRFERGRLDRLPIAKEMGLRNAHSQVFWVLLRCNEFGEPQPSFPILFQQLFQFDAVRQSSKNGQPDDLGCLTKKRMKCSVPTTGLRAFALRLGAFIFIHTLIGAEPTIQPVKSEICSKRHTLELRAFKL